MGQPEQPTVCGVVLSDEQYDSLADALLSVLEGYPLHERWQGSLSECRQEALGYLDLVLAEERPSLEHYGEYGEVLMVWECRQIQEMMSLDLIHMVRYVTVRDPLLVALVSWRLKEGI